MLGSLKGLRLSTGHLVAAFVVCFGVFFSAALFRQPVVDWDEKVYLHLAERMTWRMSDYTTQGSSVDEALPQAVYGSPVFHHPPVVPFAIKVLGAACGDLQAGAKILNLLLWILSLGLVFSIARRLSDERGGLVALALWVMCPVLNLEARLIHLDFPCTVLLLAGVRLYLAALDGPAGRLLPLALSGGAFALAMLTKFTAPLFAAMPALLFLVTMDRVRGVRPRTAFLAPATAGFAWWAYVLVRFGTLAPAEFVDRVDTSDLTPYLRSISEREWCDIWIYFLAVCPLFLLYVGGVAAYLGSAVFKWRTFLAESRERKLVLALNLGALLAVVVFCLVNARGNSYWTLRHVMPLFPLVYVTLGRLLTRLFDRQKPALNAWLLAALALTAATMVSSTFATALNVHNIKVIPAPLFWLGLDFLFH